MTWVQSPAPTWEKEKITSHELSSGFRVHYTHCGTFTSHVHKLINVKKDRVKKRKDLKDVVIFNMTFSIFPEMIYINST